MRQKSGIEKYSRKLKGEFGAAIAAHKDIPVKYGSKIRDIASLEKIFLHHEENTKVINIIRKGSSCPLDPIPTRTDIDRNIGGARG